jgi:hypothetical protein
MRFSFTRHLQLRAALFVLALLAACTPTATPSPTSTVSDIQVGVSSNEFTPGTPRVPFILLEAGQSVTDAQAVQVSAYDLGNAAPEPVWTGAATSFSDYDLPYWVVYPQLPHAGPWGLSLQITRADGGAALSQFSLQVVDDVASPNVGEVPPASHNRTLATEPDIHKLTSGVDPEPALYQMTVAEALTSGKPTVVVFATPGYCTSRLCAPVVHSVEAVYRAHSNDANFIHLEVYKSFDPLVGSDEIAEWQLTSEPWVFVLDREGKVAARLSGPVSPRELTLALAPLLGP